MKTKICNKCDKERDLDMFAPDKRNGDGKQSICRICKAENDKMYYDLNRNKLIHKQSIYSNKNQHKIVPYKKQYAINNAEKISQYQWEYRIRKRKEINKKKREYFEKNPDRKVAKDLRSRINDVLNGKTKYYGLYEVVGCSLDFLKNHLESQFTEIMNWDNHTRSGWHIDHIIPCSAFDFNIPAHQRACFHWTNLQPMWGKFNIQKGNKYSQEDFDKHLAKFM
jgi:hypothetical protein